MPSGNTHDRITLWSLPAIVAVTILLTGSGEVTLIVAGSFLFSGLMFGPDLDIYSIQFKRWGYLRSIWLPYRKFIRHRSVFSHGIILGTIGRLLYLGSLITFVAIFAIAIAQLIWGFTWNWQTFVIQLFKQIFTVYPQEAIALLVGLELGSLSHSLSDWIVSAYKGRQKTVKPPPRRRKKTKK